MSLKGDFGTMQARIMDEMDRTRDEDKTIAGIGICTAILEYRYQPFHFNTNFITSLTLTPGDNALDVLTLITDDEFATTLNFEVEDPVSGRGSQVFECGLAEFRQRQRDVKVNGRPRDFIWHSQEILLHPTPDVAYVTLLDYVKDIGTPRYLFDEAGQSWQFQEPDGTALEPTYTNDWFKLGEALIRNAAKRVIYEGYLMDTEKLQGAMGQEQSALEKLQATHRMMPPRRTSWRG